MNNNAKLILLISMLLVTYNVGCYVERKISPSVVPAPHASQHQQEKPVRDVTTSATSAPVASQEEANDAACIVESFRTAYAARGRPRVIVYLNRSLSDEVQEWNTQERLVEAREQSGSELGQTTQPISTRDKEAIAIYDESKADTGQRAEAGSERWVWSFEDGVLQPLLRAETVVIDRAIILRLQAAQLEHDHVINPISSKQIETKALKEYADVLIEILISRRVETTFGYEFKASAKEIATGRILANVTSLNWSPQTKNKNIVIVTPEGYEVVNCRELPRPQEAGAALALDIMEALNSAWSK